MKYQIPVMLAQQSGTIVVTSSSNAIATQAKRGAYAAGKRGLVALVQAAALDYAVWQAAAAAWAKTHVPGLSRMANPEEIAEFALVLASDEHPFLTGAALVIDGGKTAQGG
jgi:NAD(P)-dependent dehydrogenase (short-subunit alcohol dehydrogenase family)